MDTSTAILISQMPLIIVGFIAIIEAHRFRKDVHKLIILLEKKLKSQQ